MAYKLVRNDVTVTEIPDWERRPPKWNELVDAILAKKPGEGLEYLFDDPAVAERARSAVRDQSNLKMGVVSVRTRVVKNDDGTATLYLYRVNPPKKQE